MSGSMLEEYRARLRDALGAIKQLRAELDDNRQRDTQPIAIIGMACRLPKGINTPQMLWAGLRGGIDAIGEMDRWPEKTIPQDVSGVYWAGLLEQIEKFDASFFGISPREATALDPQQRLLLEVVWEALEDAGQVPGQLRGSKTGVFVGATNLDYQQHVAARGNQRLDAYGLTGNLLCTAAGRISYSFDFQGPCLTIDTACSSSLVALHLGVASLRKGESDLVIAAGVNVILSPAIMTMLARSNALSADGRCKTFDASANGYVRSEGCAALLLKRLADAQRDGDRIWALIRGSAVNQDGRSTGLTTPNVLAQQDVLRQALANAAVDASDIGYVEAHGTGTPLGDPIEMDALKAVYGKSLPNGAPLIVGALKTNLGHLESVSGIASVMKAVLAFREQLIPRNNHFRMLNPRISLDGTRIVVAAREHAWPRVAGQARRAGVSAFGISGTNAHVILEESPTREANGDSPKASAYLLPLSAKTRESLSALAQSYAEWFSQENRASLEDIIYTASVRRTHHEHRLSAVAHTRGEFATLLRSFVENATASAVAYVRSSTQGAPRVVFIFPGQGSQWVGMGRQLLAAEPVFRQAIDDCEVFVQREAGFSIREQIAADESLSRQHEVDVIQPLLFALEVALAMLWRSWGIEPDCVVGHSMGEVAAAHIAGMLSLEDAATIICRRSRLLKRISGQGAMALVELPMAEAENAIVGYENQLSVAVSNGPRSTVLSGHPAALDEVLAKLTENGVFCRRVKVDVASHSPQVDPLLSDLRAQLGAIRPMNGKLHMQSTVTGKNVQGHELVASYWIDNLREPVRFSQVTQDLMGNGHQLFIEMSPHPILLPSIDENLKWLNLGGAAIASMRRQTNERLTMLEALGVLHSRGCMIDWNKLFPVGGHVVTLPAYSWQRERYWVDTVKSRPRAASADGEHPLLGTKFTVASQPRLHVWEQWLSVDAFPYLADHRVHGEIVFPGTGYVEMALAAARSVYGEGAAYIEHIAFEQMLSLGQDEERRVQISLMEEGGERATIIISSNQENSNDWVQHASGMVRIVTTPRTSPPAISRNDIEKRCTTVIENDAHYACMESRGLFYGPTFQGVTTIRVGDNEILARVRVPDGLHRDIVGYRVHPALLDACFQATSWALRQTGQKTFVPIDVGTLRIYDQMPAIVWAHARVANDSHAETPSVTVNLYDDAGRLLLEVGTLHTRALDFAKPNATDPFADCIYEVAWRKSDLATTSAENARGERRWLVLSGASGFGSTLVERLRAQGDRVVEVVAHNEYLPLGENAYRLDPTDLAHWKTLLTTAFGKHGCQGIVDCLPLDGASFYDTTEKTLDTDMHHGVFGTLRLVQAVLKQGWRDVPRLYVLTRGAQAVETTAAPLSVSQSMLWGMGRVIATEQSDLGCVRIDLPMEATFDEPALILRECIAGNDEDQVAYRSGQRYVARLVRGRWDAARNAVPIRGDGTYLITGGLGGLGLSLASWLLEQGAKYIVLMGRSKSNAAAEAAIAAMRTAGATVQTMQANVARRADVDAVVSRIALDMPPLRGVVHAAAVLADRTLAEMSEAEFFQAIEPKVFGAWNLHEATRNHPLDFFVMYSAAAGLLGSPGQANYAAANTFLDALSHARLTEGLPSTSIQWGPFADVGLAAASDIRGNRISSRGSASFKPSEGNELFMRALASLRPELAVTHFDVRQWVEFYPQMAGAPFVAELIQEAGQRTKSREGNIREELENVSPTQRRARLERHLIEHVAKVLRLDPAKIDIQAPFTSMGMDSLMSLELRNRLEASLTVKLSAALLFTYATIAALAGFILEKLEYDKTLPNSAIPQKDPPRETEEPAAETTDDEDLLAAFDASAARVRRENLA